MAIDELGVPATAVNLTGEGDLLGQWDGHRLTQLMCILIGNALAGLSGLDRDTVRRQRREKFLNIGRVL